jgi:hypothetical protein
LTGDQIYADDVAKPLFEGVQKLANDVFGYVESLPMASGDIRSASKFPALYSPDPEKGADAMMFSRKFLTSLKYSPIGFTTDDGDGHLLTFPEFAAMYMLVWNEQLWTSYVSGYNEYQHGGKETPMKGYERSVRAARRVLANVATYMILDDHEITDDWNLSAEWAQKTTTNPTARRIISNGLASAFAFQAWGNDPARYDEAFIKTIVDHLDEIGGKQGEPGSAAAQYDKTMLERHWSFVAPTVPPVLCVDTRTQREFPKGATCVLSGPNVWPDLRKLSLLHKLEHDSMLVVVLATPMLAHPLVRKGQAHKYPKPLESRDDLYSGDHELYPDNPVQRAELVRFFKDLLNPKALIIFSGDVHNGSVVNGLYGQGNTTVDLYNAKADWVMRVVQITSSAIKNVNDSVAEWGKFGQTVTDLTEVLHHSTEGMRQLEESSDRGIPIHDAKYIGMWSQPVDLTGPLGHRTFVQDNHICVVDLPAKAGGDVKATFVGALFDESGALETGTASLAQAEGSVPTTNAISLLDRHKLSGTERMEY